MTSRESWREVLPPERVFPGIRAEEFRPVQGAEEAWYVDIWLPFWNGLDETEKDAYFDFWNVASEWRTTLRMLSEMDAYED